MYKIGKQKLSSTQLNFKIASGPNIEIKEHVLVEGPLIQPIFGINDRIRHRANGH